MNDAQRLQQVDLLLATIGQRVVVVEQSLDRCPRSIALHATLRSLRNQERLLTEARYAIIEAALLSIAEASVNI